MSNIVSFFSGAGGLDLGMIQAGFKVVYANEFDREIWDTYEHNHRGTELDRRSIVDVRNDDVPECDGIIGGPPCQSWSEAGSKRGITDHRGQLFFEFIRILEAKKPKFFLAENVSGMLAKRHSEALTNIKKMFSDAGYDLHFQVVNAKDYGVAQDRKRVIFIGFLKELNIDYKFPEPLEKKKCLRDVILDLDGLAQPALEKQYANKNLVVPNHEYMTGGFSTMYMSRNRVRGWDQPSFTIQAGGRHAPIHPSAPAMRKVRTDEFEFIPGHTYRRLSVRECARIQGFPDDFVFRYDKVPTGYKMIGNAVPVGLAYHLGLSINNALRKARLSASAAYLATA